MPAPQRKPRNPVLAALASLTVPGLGQLYNGQPRLAAVWAVAYLGATCAYLVKTLDQLAAPNPAGVVGSLGWMGVLVLLWLGGVVQAVFAALDRPDYELRDYNRGTVYLLAYLLAYVAFPLVAAFPLARWVMARNGITTPAERAAWLARARGLRPGPTAGATAQPEGKPVDIKIDIPDPEKASAAATTVIHLVVVGGPDGGIYDIASPERLCTRTEGSKPSWAGLYANPRDSTRVTAVQFRVPVESGETTDFILSLNVGNMPDGRSYLVDGRRPWGEDGKGSASVEMRGAGSVIRLNGTTSDGVRIEATVQCRQVGGE